MELEEMLIEEYKFLATIGEKYFDRLYSTLNFVILFYGAFLALTYGKENGLPLIIVYHYFLPIGTYILGLFYAYNSFVITRQGYQMIRLEKKIRDIGYKKYNDVGFLGWNILSKKYGGGYILPYGTSLMLFVILPLYDYFYGLYSYSDTLYDIAIIVKYGDTWSFNYVASLLPILFFIIYLSFMLKIIINIIKMDKMTKKLMKYELNVC